MNVREIILNKKIIFATLTISILLTLISPTIYTTAITQVNLLYDTNFANGYRAAWNYGDSYTINNDLKKGDSTSYRDIYPYYITVIPSGDDVDKYWEWQTGIHKNFTDYLGRWVDELHEHRVEINPAILVNTSNRLLVTNYNNYGIATTDPLYNTKIVHSMDSNKSGKLTVYNNTANEIRNVAINFGSQYAEDTWPHQYLQQNFKQDIDLAAYERVPVSFNLKLTNARQIDTWPNGISGANPSEANMMIHFFLRQKDAPTVGMFFGLMLYSSQPGNYNEYMSTDQWGQGIYRIGSGNYGGNLVLNTTKTISYDLKKLVSRAIAYAQANGKSMKASPDDYTISIMQLGWEDIGNWETSYELSDFSVKGETASSYTNAWEFDIGTQGWDNTPNQCTVTASSSKLIYNLAGLDPYCYSPYPLNFAASSNKLIRIKIKNNATTADAWSRIFWTTNADPYFNVAKSRAFKINGSYSDYKEYILNFENQANWSDTITQIRVDPLDDGSASSGNISFDYIRISN